MKTRPYRSTTRQLQAEATKQRILAAARELFIQEGFDKTTIASVAERASVSAPNIYARFKSKEGLLRELMDTAVFGEEYRVLVDSALSHEDVAESLRTTAKITRYVCETEEAEMSFIRGAALLSPAIEQLEQAAEQLRYECQDKLVDRLSQANVIRPGLTIKQVHDILWSLTSRELYRMMVTVRKWTPEHYETWLADTLVRVLLRVRDNS